MTTIMTLAVKLIAQSENYTKAMKDADNLAQKTVNNIGANMQKIGGSMMDIGKKATAGLTLPIVGAAVKITNMASNLEQSIGGVESVFGDAQNAIFEFGETAATVVGLSKRSFNELSTVGGALLQNLGFDAVGAADEMVNLAKRGSDVAATFGGPVENVLMAVQSALKGEFNPLEQFGVKMNQAAIDARALSLGLVEATVDMNKLNSLTLKAEKAQDQYNKVLKQFGPESFQAREAAQKQVEINEKLAEVMEGQTAPITDAARAQAALSLFYEQTAKTQGQFAREAETLAGQTERMKAQFENAASALGDRLLPIGLKVVSFVSDLIGKFTALSPAQQDMILKVAGIVAVMGPAITFIGGLVSAIGAIIPVVTFVAGVLTFPLIAILLLIAGVIALVAAAWKNNWGGIREKTAAAVEFIKTIIGNFLNTIKVWWAANGEEIMFRIRTIWNVIKIMFGKAFDVIKTLFQAFSAAFSGDWHLFGEKLREAWEKAWAFIKLAFSMFWISIKPKIIEFIDNVINFFRNTDWGEVGKNIMRGIKNGIMAGLQWVVDAAENVAQAALDAAKGFLGISSPSALFENVIGKNMALGLTVGFENNLDPLNMSGLKLSPVLAGSVPSVGASTRGAGSGQGRGGGNETNQLLRQLVAKKPLDERMLARAIRDEILRVTQ